MSGRILFLSNVAIIGGLLLLAGTQAQARDFPVRPVKIIVPYAVGNGADIFTRVLAGTPRAIVERIHGDVTKVMADPEFREEEMLAKGYEPTGLGPEEFAALMRRESQARAAMVKLSGAKAD